MAAFELFSASGGVRIREAFVNRMTIGVDSHFLQYTLISLNSLRHLLNMLNLLSFESAETCCLLHMHLFGTIIITESGASTMQLCWTQDKPIKGAAAS